jgi:hypothetical protein
VRGDEDEAAHSGIRSRSVQSPLPAPESALPSIADSKAGRPSEAREPAGEIAPRPAEPDTSLLRRIPKSLIAFIIVFVVFLVVVYPLLRMHKILK